MNKFIITIALLAISLSAEAKERVDDRCAWVHAMRDGYGKINSLGEASACQTVTKKVPESKEAKWCRAFISACDKKEIEDAKRLVNELEKENQP